MKNIRNYAVTTCDIPNFIKNLYSFLTNGKMGEKIIWNEGLRYCGDNVHSRFICAKRADGKELGIFDSESQRPVLILSLKVRNHNYCVSSDFTQNNSLNSDEYMYIMETVLGNALALLNICDCTVVNEQPVAAEGR